jgi:hypothetical protein
MPEGPEIDTDAIKDALGEARPGRLLRNVALTTALLAALGAVAALQAGDTVNEALILKTEAGRAQAEASDQWAFYQAKGIKASVQEAARGAWLAAGKTPPPGLADTIQRYTAEQRDIERAAREKEQARDEASQHADRLLQRHHRFANSVAFIQVAIALGAVAALTQNRVIWMGSLLLGVAGAGLFALTFFR